MRSALACQVLVSAIAQLGAQPAAVRPADLRAHVEFLASDLLEGRATPSEGLDVAAEYIAVQFRRAGLRAQPDGTYFQTESEGRRNVIGMLPGSSPTLSKQYVLVTAHYDHVGICAEGEADPICNGANDNASGVASMIEVARSLSSARPAPRRSVVFIAYYGEELGLYGSRYYAANPVYPIESTVAQVNFEQMGRTDDAEMRSLRTINVTGFDYSEVAAILAQAAARLKIRVGKRPKWTDEAFERSDNEALAKKGVPAHTLTVSYMFADYHRPADEWDKLDYVNMAAVTRAAAAGVLALANRSRAPRWYAGAPFGGAVSTDLARPARKPPPPAAKPKAPASGKKPGPAL